MAAPTAAPENGVATRGLEAKAGRARHVRGSGRQCAPGGGRGGGVGGGDWRRGCPEVGKRGRGGGARQGFAGRVTPRRPGGVATPSPPPPHAAAADSCRQPQRCRTFSPKGAYASAEVPYRQRTYGGAARAHSPGSWPGGPARVAGRRKKRSGQSGPTHPSHGRGPHEASRHRPPRLPGQQRTHAPTT